jgi:hypothetical protein
MLHFFSILKNGGATVETRPVEGMGKLIGGKCIHKHKSEELGARSLVAEHFLVENKIASQEKRQGLDVHHWRRIRGANQTAGQIRVHFN